MISRRFLAILICGLCAIPALDARRKKSKVEQPACSKDEKACKDLKNPCKCYCAFKPGPRDKVADDKPICIKDDPEGNYCYCKKRDIDKVNAERKARNEPEISYEAA